MENKVGLGLLAMALSWGICAPSAWAMDYQCKFAPINPDGSIDVSKEINSSSGGARPLIAAGRMGLKFWTDTSSDENAMFLSCPKYSTLGTTWKDGCDPMGLKLLLNTFPGQNWIEGSPTLQDVAIQGIYSGISINPLWNDGSPVLVPLFGHPTHWGTIFRAGFSGSVMDYAEWFDSGPAGLSDGQMSYYNDGPQGADGDNFKTMFYKVIKASYLSQADKYLGRYVYLYDPPPGMTDAEVQKRARPPQSFSFRRSPGVLKPGEVMSEDIAQSRLWESIELAQFTQSPAIWSGIKDGYAGAAWKVYGTAPSGEPWDYYLVPILSQDGRAIGMARLSTIDGACHHVWAASYPSPFMGVTSDEAALLAQKMLLADETLNGGQLMWDARLIEPEAPSPFRPNYSFNVTADDGEPRGEILVSLHDGGIIFREPQFLD